MIKVIEKEENKIVRLNTEKNWVKNFKGSSYVMKMVTYYVVPMIYTMFTLVYFVSYVFILFPETTYNFE